MKKSIKDVLFLGLPLNDSQKRFMEKCSEYLSIKDINVLKKLLKTRKAKLTYSHLGISDSIMKDFEYPKLFAETKDQDSLFEIDRINHEIGRHVEKTAFELFSNSAYEKIPMLIASNITGHDEVKKAAAIQLFAKNKVHVLLLGDPGTGKTDILRSTADFSPVSSFGLGSGSSGAGLSVSFSGKEAIKGLLPQADGGLCAIDELNLIKREDMAAFYSAMEKGFVSYDKADKHIKLNARVNVLATANPKGDKFSGWMVETLKKQLPFDSALLSRFHLIFLVRKPDINAFARIAKKIVGQDKIKLSEKDIKFIKAYVDYAKKSSAVLPKNLADQIIEFSKSLKKDEKKFLLEVNPRLVHGIVNMAKASARLNLRDKVDIEDIERVKEIFLSALYIKKE